MNDADTPATAEPAPTVADARATLASMIQQFGSWNSNCDDAAIALASALRRAGRDKAAIIKELRALGLSRKGAAQLASIDLATGDRDHRRAPAIASPSNVDAAVSQPQSRFKPLGISSNVWIVVAGFFLAKTGLWFQDHVIGPLQPPGLNMVIGGIIGGGSFILVWFLAGLLHVLNKHLDNRERHNQANGSGTSKLPDDRTPD